MGKCAVSKPRKPIRLDITSARPGAAPKSSNGASNGNTKPSARSWLITLPLSWVLWLRLLRARRLLAKLQKASEPPHANRLGRVLAAAWGL